MARSDDRKVHWYIPKLVEKLEARRIDRREFLRTSTLLGLSAATAYGIVGKVFGESAIPAARAQGTPKKGGVLKISMRVPDLKNPHTFSWVYDSNTVRQVNDYLTRTGVDNVTRPWLLDSWEASDDLKTWTLNLRQGSLGCPKNLVDSEVMLGLAQKAGHQLTRDAADADVLVVNTCAFIDKAKQESIDAILEMAEHKKTGRCKTLVVAGCMAERYRDELRAQIPEIDAVHRDRRSSGDCRCDWSESDRPLCASNGEPGPRSPFSDAQWRTRVDLDAGRRRP